MKTLFKKPILLAVLAWLALWACFFAPVLPRGKVLAPLDILETLERPWARIERIDVWNAFCYDAISQYIPYDYSVYKSLRDDGYVGWNPDTHNGRAIRENHMLCPSSLRHVFYRFLPFWDAWDWGRAFHFLLAGIGMILLLREAGVSAFGALLGAVTFSFSSQMMVWIHSDVIASGCCWSPWMLWSLFRLRRLAETSVGDRNPRACLRTASAVLLAGAFTGAALRCGFLHTALFNLTLLVLFLLSEIALRRGENRHRGWLPFVVAVAIGLAVAAPWFASVVPPALHGGHALHHRSLLAGAKALPTLVTTLFPNLLGSPQGLDGCKAFGGDFYDVKFVGGTMFVLALLALFRRDAPRFPKILFVLFLSVPFTPLATWYYHRCFVLSAIGAAWLAAWRLDWQAKNGSSRSWRRILLLFGTACVLWLVASVVLQFLESSLLPKVQHYALDHLPANKIGRANWMTERAARFCAECKIWSPWTAADVLAFGCGLFAASRIRHGQRRNALFFAIIILATFSELALFGARIVRPCDRPDSTDDAPFPDCEWVARFKSHLGNGSVLFWQPPAKNGRADFDYMQINAPSAHGIRQAEGYESVQPARLAPADRNAFDPADFARAGISHVSTPHGFSFPNADIWHLVEASPDYDLYKNPAFHSIFLVRLADGSEFPLFADAQTPNSIHLVLPAGTHSLRLAMTHHPGWRYCLGDGDWAPLPPSKDGRLASEISLPASLQQETDLHLRFR